MAIATTLALLGEADGRVAARQLSSQQLQRDDVAGTRPNILLIIPDDQRLDRLEVMPKTKRLFEKNGTEFTHGYVTTPFCCPSRASIMTGMYAHNHGILSGSTDRRAASEPMQELTIQKALQEAGYATAMYGKMLNSWDISKAPSYWDDWSIFSNSAPHGYRYGHWNVNGTIERIDRYSTSYIRSRARSFITRQEETADEQPWYMVLAPAAPHAPFTPQERYRGADVGDWFGNRATFETDRTDKPAWVQARSVSLWRGQRIRRKQLRTLMSVDDMVGAVLAKARELGENRDTLAIYISDNGYLWGDHGLDTKRFPYLPSVHVPFFMRWPGHVARSAADERIAANIDVAPTFAHVAGVELPSPDGRSLFEGHDRDRLLLEFFQEMGGVLPNWASTITKHAQYTEYYDEHGVLLEREYYDLISDPWQLENLYGDADVTNDPDPRIAIPLNEDRRCAGESCP
ncbi:MAG TPA: sulfatase [Actinomycetota bacterium]|nr:sulfatase [Actinomycetota bacterium]